MVFLEVDEGQHRFGYCGISCDMKRMSKVYESLALEGSLNQTLRFLRYNPDSYHACDVLQKFPKKEREAWLIGYLDKLGKGLHDDGLRLMIDYAFYDTSGADDTRPQICYDPEYNPSMRQLATNVTPLRTCLTCD